MDADVDATIEHLTLMAKSTNTLLADAAEKALADMVLKWTFNPNQSRIGGRFTSGTGGNQTTAQPRPAAGVVKPKPVNPAAVPRAKVNPAMPVSSGAVQAPATAHPGSPPAGHAGAEARSRTPTMANMRGDETLTISHRSTAQTRQEAARQASHERALSHQAAAAERAEMAAVRAKISGAKIPGYATTAQRDKAVSAMEKKYGIPQSMRGMSTAKKNAVAEMRSATRRLTTAKAEQARYQARVNAIKAAVKKGQTAKTQAYLAAQLAKAKATLATSKKKTAGIQAEFNTAAKAWK